MPSPTDTQPTARHLAAVLLATGALAGCAQWPEPAPTPDPSASLAPLAAESPSPVAPPPASAAATPPPDPALLADAAARRLLAFNERVRQLPPADVAREQARLSELPPDPSTTLELALVLAQTRQPGDLTRAVGLLEPLTRTGAAGPWQSLARLLYARLAEQRRLEEQGERLTLQLREQQRRLDQLTSQLEALKAIERSLATRPAPLPGPAAPASGRSP